MTKILFLATANQLDMMQKSCSRYDDIELTQFNLARQTLSEVNSELGKDRGFDIAIVMLPSSSALEEMKNLLDSLDCDSIISVGKDIRLWSLGKTEKDIALKTYEYLSNSGNENYNRVIDFVLNRVCGRDLNVLPPVEMPMHGLVDLNNPGVCHNNLDSYKQSYGWVESKPSVAFSVTRESWVSGNMDARQSIFRALEEAGFNVVAVMSKPKDDPNLGAWGLTTAIYKLLTNDGEPMIDAFIANAYMQYDVMDGDRTLMNESELVRAMNIPIFCPMELRTMTQDEWKGSMNIGSLLSTRIVIPEIKGYIEPIPMSALRNHSTTTDYVAIEERCRRIAGRMYKRAMLRRVPNKDKKVVFMMNIGPCSTVEATLGLAHGLDSMESVVRILKNMKERGFDVIVPNDGDELRKMFIDRRAYPEFRWTAVGDTVSKGGSIYRMSADEYRGYFSEFTDKVQNEVTKVWGEPPGEGMLDEGEIIITGIQLGKAMVMIQPKRGCVGRECSGEYCKILTDPYCPPNHHYLATYMYIQKVFGADMIIGMGSHGTMEHLPGKSNGLGPDCYPDICIGDIPNLYVFDACDGGHASIAKRRGYATMLSHAPASAEMFMMSDGMKSLYDLLGTYDQDKSNESYDESFMKDLESAIAESGMIVSRHTNESLPRFIERVKVLADSAVSSKVETRSHVYGEILDDEECVNSLMESVSYNHPNVDIDVLRTIIEQCVNGSVDVSADVDGGELKAIEEECDSLLTRIRESDEMTSLLDAMEGRYTEPGPAGNLFRGKTSIFPTGKNLHTSNPELLPTKVSYRIGCELADKLIEAYREEHGEYPEELALSWMSNDIVIADGELIAQAMSLIGVEPVWSADDKVSDFRIIPIEELRHPRIDVLIRPVSLIISLFRDRLDLLDRAITAVAQLDEPPDVNYVHAHSVESIASGVSETEASSRIFGVGPGLSSGLYYAVMASAWEKDSDLAEIFLNNNGYAYGAGKDGVAMHGQFGYQLSKASATFNKIASDDKDLLLSGGFFTSQGGIALASEYLTGRKIQSYYGDSRRSDKTQVRTLSEEISRLSTAKVLNPQWIESNMKGGYAGATAMMGAVQRLYGWQITSKDVDDEVFNGITREYVMNKEVRDFFTENNPFAIEDLERRLLELEARGLWTADPDVLEELKNDYLEIEGLMEDVTDDPDCQRGELIVTRMSDEYAIGKSISSTNELIGKRLGKDLNRASGE